MADREDKRENDKSRRDSVRRVHPIKIMPDLSAAKATPAYTSGAATKSKVA